MLVLHPRDQDGDSITRHLRRLGCRVETIWPPPAELPGPVDVVFRLIDQQTRGGTRSVADTPSAATVAVVDRETPAGLALLAEWTPQAVLIKPLDPMAIATNLMLAWDNFRYEQRLLSKIAKLEEALRSIRKVERAKAILMKSRALEEADAYEYLRTQAMKKRVSISVVASAVIEASEVLS